MSVKKGDPVRVRLSSGEVVDAVYDKPVRPLGKCHWVRRGNGTSLMALGGIWERKGIGYRHQCRFVGPTPMVKKENNND